MNGLLFLDDYSPTEYARQDYRGLLMGEPYYSDQPGYVPYDPEFMIMPEDLDAYRREMQLREGMSMGRSFLLPPDVVGAYRMPHFYGEIPTVYSQAL